MQELFFNVINVEFFKLNDARITVEITNQSFKLAEFSFYIDKEEYDKFKTIGLIEWFGGIEKLRNEFNYLNR